MYREGNRLTQRPSGTVRRLRSQDSKGKPLAALVPAERLEHMRRFARRHAVQVLGRQVDLALETRRWARGHSEQQAHSGSAWRVACLRI